MPGNKKVRHRLLPVVKCVNLASAFRRQGQSGTAGHGLVQHFPALVMTELISIVDVYRTDRSS
jgi:hypothetical protein